ncbi:hypothetical protein Sjap_012695 [Stephania japonica]|uniref:G patch domain-containing protein 11 n=1 Tax=Stephania japonica TaxID=461633 RepID=A0AAP0IY99_9MAGN
MAATTPNNNEDDKEDYMGDLSLFLPPPLPSPKPSSSTKTLAHRHHQQPLKKKLKKTLNWQEQRQLDRERKQREEDEKTLANINSPIPQSNIGFKMLKMMGYSPGSGAAEPVALEIRRSRRGIGKEDPLKERARREEARVCEERRRGDHLVAEFGTRQKSQWRGRRVVLNFGKAKAALHQLEESDEAEAKAKAAGGEDGDEEEEEVITEEDLQNILMKLRDEHRYCLFCGCQYESTDALLSNCPGIDEDDH